MLQPSCEQKEHLIAVYVEAVHAYYNIVRLLNAVRRQQRPLRELVRSALGLGPHWSDIAKRTDADRAGRREAHLLIASGDRPATAILGFSWTPKQHYVNVCCL